MTRIGTMLRSHDMDPQLLRLFEALWATGSVTLAGREVGLSQSGASRALARLRALVDDPLFVPEGHRLVPTARAHTVRDAVHQALAALDAILDPPRFDPHNADGTLRLGIPDHLALLFLPALLERLARQAPGIDVVATSFSRDWADDLRAGRIDLAFGVVGAGDGALRMRRGLEDGWSVVLRADHPDLDAHAGPWDAARFARGTHGLMTVTGAGPGQVDRALSELGLARRVVVRTSSPLVVALLVEQTDLKVTTSTRLAHHLAQRGAMAVLPLPFKASPLALPLVWHARHHDNARHRWLRACVASVLEDEGGRVCAG